MGIHKGTKLTDTPKDLQMRIRADKDTVEKLTACCKATGQSKSEIIRNGIELQYKALFGK